MHTLPYTNSACRIREKKNAVKFVYMAPGVDAEDVGAEVDGGIVMISANRGPHYNYHFVNHIDTGIFNLRDAKVYVLRGVITLVVPRMATCDCVDDDSYSLPVYNGS